MKLKYFALALVMLTVAACGGGGGGGGGYSSGGGSVSSSSSSSSSSSASSSSSSSSSSSASASLGNVASIIIDDGPAAGGGNVNIPFVTVTVCAPGTTTCQTIDHVIVDTGSVGLRIEKEVLTTAMRAALPQTMSGSAQVGECYQYVDGYVFGSIRRADMTVGGETVSNMPMMVIGDDGNFATVPANCSSSGGSGHQTVADFGANGILGIGTTVYDCGSYCASTPYLYYICTGSGCTLATLAVAEQVPNPVAMMTTDNNGTIIVLPSAGTTGVRNMTGQLIFGIGTQTNNGLGGATVLTTTSSGDFTATYNGKSLTNSFIDSGTNFLAFSDSAITQCTGTLKGFYCPATALTLSATLTGKNNVSQTINLPLYNAQNLGNGGENALPGLGGDPSSFSSLNPYTNSFDFGLPFFFGKSVYTGISGRTAGVYTGPFVAF